MNGETVEGSGAGSLSVIYFLVKCSFFSLNGSCPAANS
jgi:hypothetical protein